VTFNPQIRYSDALKNSLRQEAIMQEIMLRPDIEKTWESQEVEESIIGKLIS
jgi:kynurenine 3-monooxygenase